MVANTLAFRDMEKKFYKIEPQFSTFDGSAFDQPGLYYKTFYGCSLFKVGLPLSVTFALVQYLQNNERKKY
jgi:hypothetical protein